MKRWSKPFGALALVSVALLAWAVGADVIRHVQYARASEEVEATRLQLATVQDLARVYKMIGKVVEPSVVKIDVHKTIRPSDATPPPDDFLKRFFPDRDGDGEPDLPPGLRLPDGQAPDRDWEAQGTGSGVIMEVDGKTAYVITNNHVAGNASELSVTLSDGREIKDAKLVGTDPKSDLAVVRIEAEGLIPAKWGNSDYVEKGDLICAFGSPFGYVGSMTHGIVSALNRERVGIIDSRYRYENFIQVDAPINPGNSGGPLVNLRGEVVGINTAIASRTGAFSGIGFAIPSNQARFVYDQIKEKGKVVRGWLGVEIDNVSARKEEASASGYEGTTGVLVKGVLKDAPVQGKLELDDVIVGLNGRKIENMTELRNTIAQTPPGTDLTIDVIRNGQKQQVQVTLGEQPEELSQIAQTDRDDDKGLISLEKLGVRLAKPTAQMLSEANIPDATQGALVIELNPGSPAAQAGIRVGDLITQVADTAVSSPRDAANALAKQDLSKGVKIRVVNSEGTRSLFVRTADR